MAGNNRLDRMFLKTPEDIANRIRRGPVAQGGGLPPPSASPFNRVIFPWWTEKIPSAVDFNTQNFALTLAAGAGSTVVFAGFRLPQTQIGVVQIFGIYAQGPTNLTNVTWTLRINQSPVPGWDNIQLPPGAANFVVQNFSDLRVKIPNGALVDVLITNNNASGPWTVGAKVAGWYNPSSDVARVTGTDY